jgi:hypothetical protein
MIDSFWAPLLRDGGITVDTPASGSGQPVALRTIIQIDADFTTFVTPDACANNPDLIVRHRRAVRATLLPVRRLIAWTEGIGTVLVGVVPLGVIATNWPDAEAANRFAVGMATSAVSLAARFLYRDLFSRLVGWVTGHVFRLVIFRLFRDRLKGSSLSGPDGPLNGS